MVQNKLFVIVKKKSKVFVKVTKTKVLAAFGQIIEVLFSAGKFPIGVTPTSMPEGVAEYAYLNPKKKQQEDPQQPKGAESPYGFPGDGGGIPCWCYSRIFNERSSTTI